MYSNNNNYSSQYHESELNPTEMNELNLDQSTTEIPPTPIHSTTAKSYLPNPLPSNLNSNNQSHISNNSNPNIHDLHHDNSNIINTPKSVSSHQPHTPSMKSMNTSHNQSQNRDMIVENTSPIHPQISSIPKSVVHTVLPSINHDLKNRDRVNSSFQQQSVFLDVVDAFQTYIGDKLQIVELEMQQQENEIKELQRRLNLLSTGHQEQEVYIFQCIRNACAQLQTKQGTLTNSLRQGRDEKINYFKKTISEKRDKLRQLSAVESFAKKNYCSTSPNGPLANNKKSSNSSKNNNATTTLVSQSQNSSINNNSSKNQNINQNNNQNNQNKNSLITSSGIPSNIPQHDILTNIHQQQQNANSHENSINNHIQNISNDNMQQNQNQQNNNHSKTNLTQKSPKSYMNNISSNNQSQEMNPHPIDNPPSVQSETENIFKSVRTNLQNIIGNHQGLSSQCDENPKLNNVEVDIKPLLDMINLIDFMQPPSVPKFLILRFNYFDDTLKISWTNSSIHISVDFYILEYVIDGISHIEETRDLEFKLNLENWRRLAAKQLVTRPRNT